MRTKSRRLSMLSIFLIGAAVISFLVFYLIVMISGKEYRYIDPETLELVQTEEIPEGSPVAIVSTSLGEIRFVLYPEYAPETVAQFTTLAENGHYDGTCVFDIEEEVLFAAGSAHPDGSLTGVTDAQEKIPQEIHQNLWPFRGAVCAMNTGMEGNFFKRLFRQAVTYTGTRFMVLDSVDFSDEAFKKEFREATDSDLLEDAFLSLGGVPNYSQRTTVFGQTYAGFDVIDAICGEASETPAETDGFHTPKEEILIEKIEISEYGEEDKALDERGEIDHTLHTETYPETEASS